MSKDNLHYCTLVCGQFFIEPSEMIGDILKQTQLEYRISSKQLAEISGIGASAISDIRRGASDPSWSTMDKLLMAIEQIAPGSRHYFCDLLAGEGDTVLSVEKLENQELGQLLVEIGRELQTRKSTVAKILLEA